MIMHFKTYTVKLFGDGAVIHAISGSGPTQSGGGVGGGRSQKRLDGLLFLILEGIIDVKNHRGRPRFQFISQIIEDQGCKSYREPKRKASDSETRKLASNQSLD